MHPDYLTKSMSRAVTVARESEREHCAKLVEQLSAKGFNGPQIAMVIRAGNQSPQATASAPNE